MIDWFKFFGSLLTEYELDVHEPVSEKLIHETELHIGTIPSALTSLFLVSNGMEFDWFRIIPIEDPEELDRTWDSIARANQSETSKYIDDDQFLKRFLVFAKIRGPDWAVIERATNSIWYTQDSDLHQTDCELQEFIRICCREVAEL